MHSLFKAKLRGTGAPTEPPHRSQKDGMSDTECGRHRGMREDSSLSGKCRQVGGVMGVTVSKEVERGDC
jgi:hypothetical protein